jgi:hypothetical protein
MDVRVGRWFSSTRCGTRYWVTNVSLATAVVLILTSQSVGQTLECPPPPEWGLVSKIGDWQVRRSCSTDADVLSISTKVADRLLALRCDAERGPYGELLEMNTRLREPLTLAFPGAATQTMDVKPSDEGFAIYFNDVALTRRFMASLVDGHGPIRIALTAGDNRALELVFPRNGLAKAARPLRTRCAW